MQEVRSWVTSPLGHHVLLAMFKDTGGTLNHFLKKYVSLNKKPEFTTSSKLFLAPNSELRYCLKEMKGVSEVECPRDAALHWVKRYQDLNIDGLKKNLPGSAQLVILNVSTFKSPWAKDNGNSLMKIYNSFSYTQDINYEARILELPLHDRDFKMVVIAPNDVDLLHTLFRRLSHDGLSAAICNIQPLFTTNSKLMAPVIQFTSEESLEENFSGLGPVTISQAGSANVNEQGAQFSVLSYLYVKCYAQTPTKGEAEKVEKRPFFFALVFQDSAIFAGQFNYESVK